VPFADGESVELWIDQCRDPIRGFGDSDVGSQVGALEEDWRQFEAARLGPALARATAGMPPPPLPFDTRDVTGHPTHSRRGESARV
jgi:hypothetical protein